MTKTKYWLSILAISVVLVAGSLAVSPIAIAGDDNDDDEVEASIEAELELEQDGEDVEVEVEAEGLKPNTSFTVRAYIASVTNCSPGLLKEIGSGTSDGDGDLEEISGTITKADFDAKGLDNEVDSVGSVSIRSSGPPPMNPPVVCFQDTTP